MKHADYLRQMLAPLGVYRLEGTCNGGELEAVGAALDGCAAALETVEREMLLTTAEGDGLERIEALLARRPVTSVLERRRQLWRPCCGSEATASRFRRSTTTWPDAGSMRWPVRRRSPA